MQHKFDLRSLLKVILKSISLSFSWLNIVNFMYRYTPALVCYCLSALICSLWSQVFCNSNCFVIRWQLYSRGRQYFWWMRWTLTFFLSLIFPTFPGLAPFFSDSTWGLLLSANQSHSESLQSPLYICLHIFIMVLIVSEIYISHSFFCFETK